MPKHFEFVMIAYGLWMFTFGFYVLHLRRKARQARTALERMQGSR